MKNEKYGLQRPDINGENGRGYQPINRGGSHGSPPNNKNPPPPPPHLRKGFGEADAFIMKIMADCMIDRPPPPPLPLLPPKDLLGIMNKNARCSKGWHLTGLLFCFFCLGIAVGGAIVGGIPIA